MRKEKLERIKNKIHKNRNKQIGTVRLPKEIYDKIEEISKDFGVTKQWLIRQIVTDFIIEK